MTRSRQLRSEAKRVLRYGLVGIGNTVVGLAAYALLLALDVDYLVAGACAWVLGTLHGYAWNRAWTFERAPARAATMRRYLAVGAMGLALNSVLLTLLIESMGADTLIAELAVLPVVVLITFLANRFWTFNEHLRELEQR